MDYKNYSVSLALENGEPVISIEANEMKFKITTERVEHPGLEIADVADALRFISRAAPNVLALLDDIAGTLTAKLD